jgi:capsule polysaccharide export protein KpsC/LpsZ
VATGAGHPDPSLLYRSITVKLNKSKNLPERMRYTMDEENKKLNWAGFVETTVANFFQEHNIEKLAIEDGLGNKAKLYRQKDNVIKAEYTSTTTL